MPADDQGTPLSGVGTRARNKPHRVCERCGAKIVDGTTREVCPACLLETALGGSTTTDSDRFGVYEIERHPDGGLYELGRGAMGVTYRATDTSLQRKVALKIIKIDVAERSADARERFMREARAAAALRQENIATVYQFGIREETGQYFYAMELIEGETLEQRVRRAGPLDARTTIKIAQQVTAALATAEKHGLVHRDLKPANLMLVSHEGEIDNDEKVVVKIIDFGLAKALRAPVFPMSLTQADLSAHQHLPARNNLNTLRWTCAPTFIHWAKRSGSRSQEKRHLPAIVRRRFTAPKNQMCFPSNNSKQRTFPLA